MSKRLSVGLLATAAILMIIGSLTSGDWLWTPATACVLVVLTDDAYRRQQGLAAETSARRRSAGS